MCFSAVKHRKTQKIWLDKTAQHLDCLYHRPNQYQKPQDAAYLAANCSQDQLVKICEDWVKDEQRTLQAWQLLPQQQSQGHLIPRHWA